MIISNLRSGFAEEGFKKYLEDAGDKLVRSLPIFLVLESGCSHSKTDCSLFCAYCTDLLEYRVQFSR
jgi:hypothetical protein